LTAALAGTADEFEYNEKRSAKRDARNRGGAMTARKGPTAVLFDKTNLGGLELRNRFVRSATWEGMCDPEGRPSERLADLYRELAGGKVGLIVTGYTYVSPEGKQMPGKMGIHSGAFAGEMKALAAAVHDEGGRICMQLVHCGGQTTEKMAGRRPLAPSAVDVKQFPQVPAAMSARDIAAVVAAFGEGAGRAREYGFDSVQLHAAHGYLINQFLSPLTNRREDEYGGNEEKRCRFLTEVCRSVRSAVGPGFPVLVKLNGSDFLEGGLEPEGALAAAKILAEEGVAAVEVSGGTPASGREGPVRVKIKTAADEAYNLQLAAMIKKEIACPVISVGGFRSPEVAAAAVTGGSADGIALSRPFIREPGLVKRWEEGDLARAECISCNGCFRPGLKEGGIYCVAKRKLEEKKEGSKRA
jgi:2,4-dienoyl-CoA reductase-like NADH-dependent reductase (Old Yellow Enzyme family)